MGRGFFGRLLQQGANGGCWKALKNRISPGKVGLRRAGIGRIDPDTTVRGINTEDTCRLRRIEHRPSPCRFSAHRPPAEHRKARALAEVPGETGHPECGRKIKPMDRSALSCPFESVISALPDPPRNLLRNIWTWRAFALWAASSVLMNRALLAASPAPASSGDGVLDRSSNWPRTRRFTEWSGRTARPCGPPTSVDGSLPSCWRPERGTRPRTKIPKKRYPGQLGQQPRQPRAVRRCLEIWPETPILPKLLFSWRRLPM